MAQLSTQEIRNDLIKTTLDGNADYVNSIAAQFLKEIVRVYKDEFGYTESQIEDALEHTRRNPETIVTQYYFLKDATWLREQHACWFSKEADVMVYNQRNNIQDWVENFQTTDCYDIGRCQLNWLSDRQEWQLILANKEIYTEDACKGVGKLLARISDEDIADYYAGIEDHYNDCEDISAEEKEAQL